MPDKTYKGHKNWRYWNVALWLGNCEGLYNMARRYKHQYPTRRAAAKAMLDILHECGMFKTPDGERYSIGTISTAMKNL